MNQKPNGYSIIKYKILHIDDDAFLLNLYAKKFRESGFEVIALNWLEKDFVTQIFNINPDLIISDLMRPVIDGMKVLEALRADKRTSDIPFMFLSSAFNMTDDIEKAKRFGVIECVTKAETIPSDMVDKVFRFFEERDKEIIEDV